MGRIEIYITCSSCSLSRQKSYDWLSEKHLPCPGCGNDITINESHIRIIDIQMADALREINSPYAIKTVTLKV